MPLVTSLEMLHQARRDRYAIPAFNVLNLEMVQAVIAACEAERAPLILQFNPGGLEHAGLPLAAALGRAAAAEARIPVALHLDHVADVAVHVQALRAGFTSLMVDGSPLPFDDNVALSARVCALAHAVNVPVEGELGPVGGEEEGVTFADAQETDPEQAGAFVRTTGVDCLAISVGNKHGQARGSAHLNLKKIEQIRDQAGVPLVLHGGSGVSDEEMRAAIAAGICKVNVATELHRAYLAAARRFLGEGGRDEPRPLMAAVRMAVQHAAAEKVRLFGASGRA
jgi:fructose-bisphosphate aldolase class II